MNVFLFNCIKKQDSTMPPADPSQMPEGQKFYNSWFQTECVLKENTSITDPSFIFSERTYSTGAHNYVHNYIYAPTMGRGYWVRDWVYQRGTWIANCHVDVLGSFHLPAEPQYVLRSGTDYNTWIIDKFYPITDKYNSSVQTLSNPWATNLADGRFIVGIAGPQADFGSIAYFVMTAGEVSALCNNLMSDINYMNISSTEISTELQKGLINPLQYIKSCIWIPFTPNQGTGVTNIACGWWTFPNSAHKIGNPINVISRSFDEVTIGLHPDIERGLYLMHPPYTNCKIVCPPWGIIDIPSDAINLDCIQYNLLPRVGIQITADAISGMARLEIWGKRYDQPTNTFQTTGKFVSVEAMIGIPVAMAQSSQDLYGAITSTVQGAMKGLAAGTSAPNTPLDYATFGLSKVAKTSASTVLGAGAGFAESVPGLYPSVSTNGQNGSMLIVYSPWQFITNYYRPTNENRKHYGRPLCELRDLTLMTGYVKILNPDYHNFLDLEHVQTPPTVSEMDEYESWMAKGFFIEGWLDG